MNGEHMDRFLCLHLHFYQPPRENPWLGEIEHQESAYPFHDWNERINMECYRSNGSSRILDSEGRVIDLANNYSRVSFNFGPTLLSWMEEKDPSTYERILEGDRRSLELFGGHGNAIAQAYNHVIMPLASRRDKETQVIWGLRDFEKRFRREAESMWLPETAVDLETLEIMSAHGLKFVILAPRQAKAIRSLERDEPWRDVSGEKVDPRKPYVVRLPSGRSIVAFFYDGPISKAVAFEGLLHNGETFANRLLQGFLPVKNRPQLLHIATDGETYGHHHLNGDMALAYALWYLEKHDLATITNYGQFLEKNPPRHEVMIHENSSWSCAHGIERWKSDCGCNSGTKGGWHQRWRGPVREALDDLRDQLEKPFEDALSDLTEEPWKARNDYIEVIEDRSLANVEAWLMRLAGGRELAEDEMVRALKALEVQRHLLLMYTSCGWFFDEISGIETIQNLQYAYRAIELGEQVFGVNLLESFMERLELAESNIPDLVNGRVAFERYVMPARVDYLRVGVHFAVASAFETYQQKNEVYNNKITLLEFNRFDAGKARMACGQARIRSRTTLERHRMTFGVVHFGDHNVSAGIKFFESDSKYLALVAEAKAAFERGDFPNVVRHFDRFFGSSLYSLKDLFKDEQKKMVDVIMSDNMQETEERFARLYRQNYPLMCFLADLHMPMPEVLVSIAQFVQDRSIRRALSSAGRIQTQVVRQHLNEAAKWGVTLDGAGLGRVIEQVIETKIRAFQADDGNVDKLEELLDLVVLDGEVPIKTQLGPVQNWFFLWYKSSARKKDPATMPDGERWRQTVERLGQKLRVRLPDRSADRSADFFSCRTGEEATHVPSNVPAAAPQQLPS
jgi:alpha-amylase/alpha-mannosidase (GH57 family)